MSNLTKKGWIPCDVRLPKQHDSIFAKYKNTPEWQAGMYAKTSGNVNVTLEYSDGSRRTDTDRLRDGKWGYEELSDTVKVIAWQPLPEPYQWA